METKTEILSYNNCKDLKRKTNPKTVAVGAVALLAGLFLILVMTVDAPASNLNILRLSGGWLLCGFGLAMLLICPRHWVYAATGSAVSRRSLDFSMDQLPALRKLLAEGTPFDDVKVSDASRVHIDCYASADRQFVAVQVLQYGALADRALTPAAYLYDVQAANFLKAYTRAE